MRDATAREVVGCANPMFAAAMIITTTTAAIIDTNSSNSSSEPIERSGEISGEGEAKQPSAQGNRHFSRRFLNHCGCFCRCCGWRKWYLLMILVQTKLVPAWAATQAKYVKGVVMACGSRCVNWWMFHVVSFVVFFFVCYFCVWDHATAWAVAAVKSKRVWANVFKAY